ncbi:MAG TPA: heme-degrading domain-containing protein [Bryobacteraceae bacterium]|jgi:uncharacterized protein (UPF0303 family)|nr:heme-degrading domain-containing protein [Bryobacteraceae bacterium]
MDPVAQIEDDLRKIATQERELVFDAFTPDTAWSLGAALRDLALARGLPAVIDVRRFGQPLFYCALEGTTPDNPEWVRRKSNVVARFHRSSYAMGLTLRARGTSLVEKYGLPAADFAAHGGSFPLAVKSAGIIGSITVSGLPQRADHELAVEGLCAVLGCRYSSLALDDEGPGRGRGT